MSKYSMVPFTPNGVRIDCWLVTEGCRGLSSVVRAPWPCSHRDDGCAALKGSIRQMLPDTRHGQEKDDREIQVSPLQNSHSNERGGRPSS